MKKRNAEGESPSSAEKDQRFLSCALRGKMVCSLSQSGKLMYGIQFPGQSDQKL
jgi:hypothetical protein